MDIVTLATLLLLPFAGFLFALPFVIKSENTSAPVKVYEQWDDSDYSNPDHWEM